MGTVAEPVVEGAPAAPVAPAAPAPEPVQPAAPAPAKPASTEPLDRRSARQEMLKKMESREPPSASPPAKPAEPAATPPAPPAPPSPPTESAAAGTPPAAPAAPAAAPSPASGFEVEIPADHPAARGKALKIVAPSQAEADALRALVKGTYVRPKELQEALDAKTALELQLARIDIEKSTAETWKGTPEYAAAVKTWQQMKALEDDGQLPAGTADAHWKVTENAYHAAVDRAFTAKQQELEEGKTEHAAEGWINEAWDRANSRMPEGVKNLAVYSQVFDQALESYEFELSKGRIGPPSFPAVVDAESSHEAFRVFLANRLVREPAVMAVLKQVEDTKKQQDAAALQAADNAEREKKRIAEAAVEEFKKTTAAARAGAPPHPLGNLRSPAPASATPGSTPSDGRQPPADQTAHDLRKEARTGALQRARERFQR